MLPPEPREFLVDQAAEFACCRELPRLGGGFIKPGPGLAKGSGSFFAARGVVRLRQRRGVKRVIGRVDGSERCALESTDIRVNVGHMNTTAEIKTGAAGLVVSHPGIVG